MLIATLKNNYLKFIGILLPLTLGFFLKDVLLDTYQKMYVPQSPTGLISQDEQLYNQGIQLLTSNDISAAIKTFQNGLAIYPQASKILLRLGTAAASLNKHTEAIHFFKTALFIEPRHINGYICLGQSLMHMKQYDQALNEFLKVTKTDSTNIDAYIQASKAYTELKKFDDACSMAFKALALQPTNIHALLNIGHTYNKQGDLNNAVIYYKKVLEIDPLCANAHYNLGYTLRILKQTNQAITSLNKALELKPHYIDAHVCLAQCHWTLQDFNTAFKEYEWRWAMLNIDPKKMDIPLWNGCDLTGKKILLYCEQGLGDTLQFIRFAQLVKQKGALVTIKVQKPLVQLLQASPYIDALITDITDGQTFDYQAPLLNLPGILHIQPTTIPTNIPYIQADPQLVQYWHKKLAHDKKFRIGLCWHVDPVHEIDKSPWSIRSFPAQLFVPLSTIKNVSFYSLQKINGEQELATLPDDFSVHTFGYNFDEKHGRFMDTAAVIMNLDLIITVDTSIAHVAGALGKKVWMLLPYSADCRWYDDLSNTPWYPSMRLFRQPKPYDWQTVSKELKTALQQEQK